MYEHSVALTATTHQALVDHLLREDGQEDICLAIYTTSTGARRTTRILHTVELPGHGDRMVHGNATIMGSYVFRVAAQAAVMGRGVAILHSHPDATGWQGLSGLDVDAEKSYASLVRQVTGLPLVGLTLAGGDQTWSARVWTDERHQWAGSVRVVGPATTLSWNDQVNPPPKPQASQHRTINAWGARRQQDIARTRVLVVGVGSVGLDIAQRLAATGLVDVGSMDYDRVDEVNLDRMIGATRRDARFRRKKVTVAARLARSAATADHARVHAHDMSICSPEGLATALDYDVIFSCVDRPWARAMLNSIALSDLIPVIDGGIAIDSFPDGRLRGATRRTQTVTPGRPCLSCSGQLRLSEVTLEMNGSLDDPAYIRGAGREPLSGRPNVAALCAGVSASQLEHFVSLLAHPGGLGAPNPLRFSLATHGLGHMEDQCQAFCETKLREAVGDDRVDLSRPTGPWSLDDGDQLGWLTRRFAAARDKLLELLT